MKKHLIFSIVLGGFLNAQNFTEIANAGFHNFGYSGCDVADVDGNGYKDIVFSGAIDSDNDGDVDFTTNIVYKNNGGIFSEMYNTNGDGTHSSEIKFIDFDNDGLMDIVTSGINYQQAYRHFRFKNNGTSLSTDLNTEGKIFGNVEVFDWNHDGRQDYALSGMSYNGISWNYDLDLYKNNGSTFDAAFNLLGGTSNGSFKIVDINNDNLLDVIISGLNGNSQKILKTYLNGPSGLTLKQDLTPVSGKIAVADFNGDGFQDFIMTGAGAGGIAYLAYYKNDSTGNFTENIIANEALEDASIDAGDYNNDGYYDFAIIGNDEDYNGFAKVFLYKPSTGNFEVAPNTGLYDLGSGGSILSFDYDNDMDLDIVMSGFDWADSDYPSLTKLFKNNVTAVNQKPLPPTTVTATRTNNRLNLSWSGASDDKTPLGALRYEITVGSTAGAKDIAKYTVNTPSWFIERNNLPATVFVSVKSIDASKVMSDPSVTQQAILATKEVANNSSVAIYPNPASDYVLVTGVKKLKAVSAYDASGRVVGLNFSSNKIDVSSLVKGVYILTIEADGKTFSEKLMVR